MENLIQVAGPAEVRPDRRSWRAVSIFAAIALVLGGVVLAQGADSGTPKTKIVTNVDDGAVIDGAGAAISRALDFGAQAQIDVNALIRAIICPILAALESGPFGGFLGPVVDQLQVRFGCVSG